MERWWAGVHDAACRALFEGPVRELSEWVATFTGGGSGCTVAILRMFASRGCPTRNPPMPDVVRFVAPRDPCVGATSCSEQSLGTPIASGPPERPNVGVDHGNRWNCSDFDWAARCCAPRSAGSAWGHSAWRFRRILSRQEAPRAASARILRALDRQSVVFAAESGCSHSPPRGTFAECPATTRCWSSSKSRRCFAMPCAWARNLREPEKAASRCARRCTTPATFSTWRTCPRHGAAHGRAAHGRGSAGRTDGDGIGTPMPGPPR